MPSGCSIVRQLLAGMPGRVVAAGHDTSLVMLERNYSRYVNDHSDVTARAALLEIAEHKDGGSASVPNPPESSQSAGLFD
jgi:hypothetical protein